jgi:CRP-like cAMP-binding protein
VDGNLLLARLPVRDQKRLAAHLETVALHEGQRLFDAGDTVCHAWFPTGALISLRGVSVDGGSIELAMIAADGVVGLPLIRQDAIAPHLAVVQIAGTALRMDARALKSATQNSAVLHDALLYYSHGVLAAVSQACVCHSFHNALQRLCLWLLAATDRLRTDHLDVTHDTLSDVLGVPRPAVSAAAMELQDAQAIRYRRGRVVIVNRPRLERSACECYDVLRAVGGQSSPVPES